jgi:Na+-translocating ferredoxin:NAD+ oxidoreductase subunit G
MAKLESTLKNMVLSLLLISSVMSGALAFVYQITFDPIKHSEGKKVNDAIKKVVPSFDNDPGAEVYYLPVEGEKDSLAFYPAKKNGNLVGIAVSTYTHNGYAGNFTVMVGFLPDGTIHNSILLAHKETPGLGSKMFDSKFHDQFNDKNPSSFKLWVKKDGGDVDAITAATISSRAYCDAINRAYKTYFPKGTDGNSGATKADSHTGATQIEKQ